MVQRSNPGLDRFLDLHILSAERTSHSLTPPQIVENQASIFLLTSDHRGQFFNLRAELLYQAH
jgi:hypothetical protein